MKEIKTKADFDAAIELAELALQEELAKRISMGFSDGDGFNTSDLSEETYSYYGVGHYNLRREDYPD